MIYLDNHATTACDPRVVEKMLPFFTEAFGNPASLHEAGGLALSAVREARAKVADLIGGHSDEIVFTSGATESNNLALKGCVGSGDHVVASAIEHRAVLDTCEYLRSIGADLTLLPVESTGLVDPDAVLQAIRPNTKLVSIMHSNNEVGVLQPITEIGRVCRSRGVPLHTDAAQSLGKVPLDVDRDFIDLLSGTAHKIYGPKGAGFLYVRRRVSGRLRQRPQLHGGGHEGGLRSGTLNVPGIVGLGVAAQLAREEMISDGMRATELASLLLHGLQRNIPDLILNGHATKRLPGNLNIRFPGADAQALLQFVSGLCVSTGSACSSQKIEPSHVLLALGLQLEEAFSSIRIGIGRFNTEAEIELATTLLGEAVQTLRMMA